MADKQNLLLLFEHPIEPVFMGKSNNTVFDVPDNFVTKRFKQYHPKSIGRQLDGKYEKRIPVKSISIPDLSVPMSLKRNEQFSLFIPRHSRIAGSLIDIFMGLRSVDDLQSVAAYARDRVNPLLFNYALSVTLLHHHDTKDLVLPSFVKCFPDQFMHSQVFRQMREELTLVRDGSQKPITIPRDYTASDLEPEHRLWYFREDMGINAHHWHWHLVYPTQGDRSIVNKDRRGELFYYMHEQTIARYNLERFSNHLPRVVRLNNLREPIAEGYFPKMDSLITGQAFPPRLRNTVLSDINREETNVDVADLERWRDRIFEAIHQGSITDISGTRIPLDEQRGIDILGNIVESTILSPNRDFYGNLHNNGHLLIGMSHDPDHRHLEDSGVIASEATAMRDPVFYRWHAYINHIFQEHKKQLPAYEKAQLQFAGISVTGIQVASEDETKPNRLNTFWQESLIDLSIGMNYLPTGKALAFFTHLQHAPFNYTIDLNNDSGAQRFGYVRIFLGPKSDECGRPMLLRDQRLFMIELDKFVATLDPGANILHRRSEQSSVTIPLERAFRDLQQNRLVEGSSDFCGCGWPSHMLIPKGLPDGLLCELFVMVSDYELDRIDQELVGTCSGAASYCGIRDRLYPDRRAMGYPFDRLPHQDADMLSKFLTPNMRVVDIIITHQDKTKTVANPN